MKAYTIAVEGECVLPTLESMQRFAPKLEYCRWPAVTPDEVEAAEAVEGIRWTYPDFGTATIGGLRCHAYKGDKMKRRAVFWSHFMLWQECVAANYPICILESDALFTRPFAPSGPIYHFGLVAINDPVGATRKASEYRKALDEARPHSSMIEVPWVDDKDVPQGTPGASAYILFPWFAAKLIAKAREIGARPNDCLTIKQFFPGKIGVLTNPVTKVSGRRSTLR